MPPKFIEQDREGCQETDITKSTPLGSSPGGLRRRVLCRESKERNNPTVFRDTESPRRRFTQRSPRRPSFETLSAIRKDHGQAGSKRVPENNRDNLRGDVACQTTMRSTKCLSSRRHWGSTRGRKRRSNGRLENKRQIVDNGDADSTSGDDHHAKRGPVKHPICLRCQGGSNCEASRARRAGPNERRAPR